MARNNLILLHHTRIQGHASFVKKSPFNLVFIFQIMSLKLFMNYSDSKQFSYEFEAVTGWTNNEKKRVFIYLNRR